MNSLLPCIAVLLSSTSAAQAPEAQAPQPIHIRLSPQVPDESASLRWSPKGAKIVMTHDEYEGGLLRSIVLGLPIKSIFAPEGEPNRTMLRLTKSDGSPHYDHLWIDHDRNARHSSDEEYLATPNERRGKIWSSFKATMTIPVGKTGSRPYPINFWFVENPAEPDAEPALRWSRSGWHQGTFEHEGKPISVLIAESKLDGVFDLDDAWHLGEDAATIAREAGSRSLSRHAWLGEQAFKLVDIDPDGMWMRIEAFDPGVTGAEEEAAEDRLAVDRNAQRAAAPLDFSHDFAAAEALAKAQGLPLFIDFETTWCGPCKQMDALVYSAKDVVDAAAKSGVITVKVDGDEHPELVKRFKVSAYPTMLLLDPNGSELKRQVGYASVEFMAAFLAPRPAKQ